MGNFGVIATMASVYIVCAFKFQAFMRKVTSASNMYAANPG